ncbi:MAG: YciI family protein [Sulfitobacter sp.]
MPKFMFAFHGGKLPDSPEEGQRIMAKWGAWMAGLGADLADPGSILAGARTVSADGVTADGGADPLSGYMVIVAADHGAAVEIAKGCPIVENEGRVEVANLVEM